MASKRAALVLETLLQRKFGPMPDWARQRITSANEATLNHWAIRVLDAQSLEDVFADYA